MPRSPKRSRSGSDAPENAPDSSVECREQRGGLLRYYHQDAA
jgi:hypothetical protein